MKGFLGVLALTLCGLVALSNGAPSLVEPLVRYDGDQLWKVEHNALAKVTLEELEQSLGKFRPLFRTCKN